MLAFVVLTLAAVGGAVAGSVLRPTPGNRYTAEAAVLAGNEAPAEEVHRLAGLARLPYVATLARTHLGSLEDFEPLTRIEPRPALGMVAVRVAAPSPELARQFADALAMQTVAFDFALRAATGSAIPLGDFEDGYWAWLSGPRSLGPNTGNIQLSVDQPRFNRAAIDVDCAGLESCGFSRLVYYPFRAGARYRFGGWVRGDAGAEVSIAVGVAGDVTISEPVTIGSRWRRVVQDWVPAVDRQFAELRWQAAPSSTRFSLDGVWLADSSAVQARVGSLPAGPNEARIFEQDDMPRTLVAVAAGSAESPTLRAALAGALLGLLGGSVVLALIALLRRR